MVDRPKKRVRFGDREVDGTPVSTTSTSEHWNQYFLEDGSIIRMKLVATEFVRIDGEHDPDGNPVYVVRSTNVLTVESPEELKRPK